MNKIEKFSILSIIMIFGFVTSIIIHEFVHFVFASITPGVIVKEFIIDFEHFLFKVISVIVNPSIASNYGLSNEIIARESIALFIQFIFLFGIFIYSVNKIYNRS